MDDCINVLCATDANYAALCGVMLTSLLENNKDKNIRIFIFTQGISDEDRIKYNKLGEVYSAEVNILIIESKEFEKCPIWPGDRLSVAAYYRLMVSSLLPTSIEKVLYLDCDLIVNGSIEPLWQQDINDVAVGAVPDAQFFNEEFYERLKLPKNKTYFNSGVMLINLKYWREHDIQERCFTCIEKQAECLRYHDQDTLNVVLQDEVKILPLTYNLQGTFLLTVFKEHYKSGVITLEDIVRTSENPLIIHYIGGDKPWNKRSIQPFKSYFRYYKQKSLWKFNDLTKQKDSWVSVCKWTLLNLLWMSGLKSRPHIYIIGNKKIVRNKLNKCK